MAKKTTSAPPDVVERNISLVGQITQYLLDHPEIFASLPDEFELVILPEDDPEIRQHNLELLDEVGTSKPIVFARGPSPAGQRSPAAQAQPLCATGNGHTINKTGRL